MHRSILVVLALVLLAGCELSHTRAPMPHGGEQSCSSCHADSHGRLTPYGQAIFNGEIPRPPFGGDAGLAGDAR